MRDLRTIGRLLVRAVRGWRATGGPLVWLSRLIVGFLLLLLLILWADCSPDLFEPACRGIAKGTPLTVAAARLEEAGGRPTQSTPTIRVWLGRAGLTTAYCNVYIDSDERVERTYYGRAYILP